MHKYINADALVKEIRDINDITNYDTWAARGKHKAYAEIIAVIKRMPAADVEPVRDGLIDQVKKYAADMEKRYTEVCADFREETDGEYVCGRCQYGDCAYIGVDGDWCGECPGFNSSECFVLSDSCKRSIWKIVDIVSGNE